MAIRQGPPPSQLVLQSHLLVTAAITPLQLCSFVAINHSQVQSSVLQAAKFLRSSSAEPSSPRSWLVALCCRERVSQRREKHGPSLHNLLFTCLQQH